MSFNMAKVNSWQTVINAVAPVFTYFMAYNAGHALNKKLDMFSKPLGARVALVRWVLCSDWSVVSNAVFWLVSWMGAMHALMYVTWFNYGNFELDTDCLSTVCKTCQDVSRIDTIIIEKLYWESFQVDAGLSYYKKILQRNKLLRETIGQEMEYYIQVNLTTFKWIKILDS